MSCNDTACSTRNHISSRQSFEWIAAHGDGWITYPRPLAVQTELAAKWRRLIAEGAPGRFKPFAQSLYIDLAESRHAEPTPIHLDFQLARDSLIDLLRALQTSGVHHVALNLKYEHRPAAEVLEGLDNEVLPYFPTPRCERTMGDGSGQRPTTTRGGNHVQQK